MGLYDIMKFLIRSVCPKKEKENKNIEPNRFLNETKEILWDVMELTFVGFWEWDIESDVVRASEAFYNICGIKEGDCDNSLYKFIDMFVHPDYRDYVRRDFQKSIELKSFDGLKIKLLRPDGEERWIRIKGMVRENKGKQNAYGIFMDITESQNNELRLHENLELLQSLIDGIPFPIFYKDEMCVYRYCNYAYAEYLRTSKENIIDHTVFDMSPGKLASVYQKKDLELFNSGGVQHYESQMMRHTGEYRDVEFDKSVIEYGCNNSKGMVGIIHDITKRKSTELELNRLNKLKDSMLEISQVVLGLNDSRNLFELIIDKALEVIESAEVGCVLVKNPDGFLHVLASRGYDEGEIPDFKLKLEETYAWDHVKGDFQNAFVINDIKKLNEEEFPKPLGTVVRKRVQSSLSIPIVIDGELVALVNADSYENHSFSENDLILMNYLKSQVEMTLSNLKLYQETARLSKYDTLTGAYNRSYFDEMIDNFITKAKRYNETFNLVILDLDQLKRINEQYGHKAGDALLKSFVKKVMENTRESDIMTRYGGDEFVTIFFETSEEEIIEKLEALNRDFVDDCFEYENQCFGCTFGYGISQYPSDGADYDDLLQIGDKRLCDYKLKRRSKEA